MRTRFLHLIRDMIGGAQRLINFRSAFFLRSTPNFDSGTPDYAYLDKARRGKARGLEVSGLLLKPIGSKITSWSFGRPPSFKAGNPAASDELSTWWRDNHGKVMGAFEESINLADYYVVVNADMSTTIIPPDAVTPIVDEQNFGKIIGWRIEMTYQHPSDIGRTQTQRDEYYTDRRVQTIITDGIQSQQRTFRNVIGRIPVVHIANNVAANEMFGHSEWEALVIMLQKYGNVLESAIEGNIRHGRPTPVIERMGTAGAVDRFWKQFGKTRTVNHADGTSETEQYLEWDADKMMTLEEDATFNWKSPSTFMGDVNALLQLMFYLLVEYCEIPEGFLGNAINGSRASLDTQLEPLVKFIEKKRSAMQFWVLELCNIVLAYANVITPSVSLDPVQIRWDDLTRKDGSLTLQTVQWAYGEGLLDEETALILLPIEVENPKEVLAKAKDEKQARQDAFNAGADARLAAAQAKAQQTDNQANVDLNPNIQDVTPQQAAA